MDGKGRPPLEEAVSAVRCIMQTETQPKPNSPKQTSHFVMGRGALRLGLEIRSGEMEGKQKRIGKKDRRMLGGVTGVPSVLTKESRQPFS